jgi:hypothetical protein
MHEYNCGGYQLHRDWQHRENRMLNQQLISLETLLEYFTHAAHFSFEMELERHPNQVFEQSPTETPTNPLLRVSVQSDANLGQVPLDVLARRIEQHQHDGTRDERMTRGTIECVNRPL